MQIKKINLKENQLEIEKDTVACIGFFDGIHKMHEKILLKTKKVAKKFGYKFIVITFDTKISDYLKGSDTKIQKPYAKYAKISWLFEPDFIVEIMVNDDVVKMSSAFFMSYLKNVLNVKKIVVGSDFRFGENAAGNISDLKQFFSKKNVYIKKRIRKYSSSRLKELINEGKIKKAKKISKNITID